MYGMVVDQGWRSRNGQGTHSPHTSTLTVDNEAEDDKIIKGLMWLSRWLINEHAIVHM
jgi:hypothetical protein